MCLAIPGRVVVIEEENPLQRPAQIDFGGVLKSASLALVPEAGVGDYVLIHAGVAIGVIDEAEAVSLLRMLSELPENEAAP